MILFCTKRWAKKLSLKVWRYLVAHPELYTKRQIPFYNKIKKLKGCCPMCEYFDFRCDKCPLTSCDKGSNFDIWCGSYNSIAEHVEAARNIVKILEEW